MRKLVPIATLIIVSLLAVIPHPALCTDIDGYIESPPTELQLDEEDALACRWLVEAGYLDAESGAALGQAGTVKIALLGETMQSAAAAASEKQDEHALLAVLTLFVKHPQAATLTALSFAPRERSWEREFPGDIQYLMDHSLMAVPKDNWSYAAMNYLQNQGYLQDYPHGYFDGSANRTRMQFARAIGALTQFFAVYEGEGEQRRVHWKEGVTEQVYIMLDTLRAEYSDAVPALESLLQELVDSRSVWD